MIIVDTTVWIDYLGGLDNPETEWLSSHARNVRIGLTDLILCEVLQGSAMTKSLLMFKISRTLYSSKQAEKASQRRPPGTNAP